MVPSPELKLLLIPFSAKSGQAIVDQNSLFELIFCLLLKSLFYLLIDNCKKEFKFPKHFDCCTDEPCNSTNGYGSCCTDNFQCNKGEGDCDQDSHCNETMGYRCGKNNCPAGFPKDFDCCTNEPKDVCIGE